MSTGHFRAKPPGSTCCEPVAPFPRAVLWAFTASPCNGFTSVDEAALALGSRGFFDVCFLVF